MGYPELLVAPQTRDLHTRLVMLWPPSPREKRTREKREKGKGEWSREKEEGTLGNFCSSAFSSAD
jgi:hypothetical protein